MNMGMIKAALLSRSALPPQYQRVEYLLKVHVSQYINLGIVPDSNTETDIVVNTGSYSWEFGSRSGYRNGGYYLYIENSLARIGVANFDVNVTISSISSDKMNIKIKPDNGKCYMKINDIDDSFTYIGSPASGLPAYLFAVNNNGSYSGSASGLKCYGLTMKNASGPIIKLIPCRRKSDNKPGMWDTVSKTFFTNAGNEYDFVLGPDVI